MAKPRPIRLKDAPETCDVAWYALPEVRPTYVDWRLPYDPQTSGKWRVYVRQIVIRRPG